MFYISFGKESVPKSEAQAAPEHRRYIAVPEQFAGCSHYFQVYENGHALMEMQFGTKREARQRLATLEDELRRASNGWYRVERKLASYRSIGSIIGFRKVYGDGSAVSLTYVIRRINLAE